MVLLDQLAFIVVNHLPVPDINFWRNTIFLFVVNVGGILNAKLNGGSSFSKLLDTVSKF